MWKNLAFTPYCGVCVLVVVGGGQDVIFMTPLSATVSRVSIGVAGGAVVTDAVHSHHACWLRVLNNNGHEHRR